MGAPSLFLAIVMPSRGDLPVSSEDVVDDGPVTHGSGAQNRVECQKIGHFSVKKLDNREIIPFLLDVAAVIVPIFADRIKYLMI